MNDRDIVASLLQMHGLTPPASDTDVLVSAYAPSRARVAKLYAMPGVRYADPALTFDPRIHQS